MIIKKIVKQKNNKYKLILDDGHKLMTYDEVILNNKLLYNKEVNLDQVKAETSYYDIYNKVISYLEKRLRSKYEINNYLNKFDINNNDKEKIMNDLISKGLINDELFAEAFINDGFYLNHNGPLKIKRELLEHHLDEIMIEDKLSKISDAEINDSIDKLVTKRIKLDHSHSPLMIKNKLLNDLISKGYLIEMVMNVISKHTITNNSISNEYDKIINRLKGEVNDFKIRQKLYQKGYSSNEINDIIAKKKVV